MSETQFPLDEAFMREFVELKRKVEDNALSASTGSIVTGDLVASAANTRTGCLLCNGDPVSRTTYAPLFAVIAETYGVGDGSTTFNLPDYEGFVLGGAGGALGAVGVASGASTVTLTAAQSGQPAIPASVTGTPSVASTGAGTAHSHPNGQPGVTTVQGGATANINGGTPGGTGNEAAHTHSMQSHTHTTPAVAAASAASSHTNIQPTLPAYIHIKT